MAFKAKEPVAIETQRLQAKSDPTQSKQLTTICSDWAGSFSLCCVDKKDTPSQPLRRNGFRLC